MIGGCVAKFHLKLQYFMGMPNPITEFENLISPVMHLNIIWM